MTNMISVFSFWKPDPIPTTRQPVNFWPIGTIQEVQRKILQITNFRVTPCLLWPMFRATWKSSIVIQTSPNRDNNVYTIEVFSAAPTLEFYKMYVQLFDHLGVIVMDEREQIFIPPKLFREKCYGPK